MFALRVGFALVIIIVVLAWIFSARIFPKIGGWVGKVFKPFTEDSKDEVKQDSTNIK